MSAPTHNASPVLEPRRFSGSSGGGGGGLSTISPQQLQQQQQMLKNDPNQSMRDSNNPNARCRWSCDSNRIEREPLDESTGLDFINSTSTSTSTATATATANANATSHEFSAVSPPPLVAEHSRRTELLKERQRSGLSDADMPKPPAERPYKEYHPNIHPQLTEHSRKMSKTVYTIVEGRVYLAYCFGLANCTMVVGNDGIVLIDAMEDTECAAEVLREFRKITSLPIRAVIYTHNHIDHVSGVRAFVSDDDVQSGRVEIIGHEALMGHVCNWSSNVGTILGVRATYSSGMPTGQWGGEGVVNGAIGPFLGVGTRTFVPPTRTFSDRLELDLAGVRVELRHVPSETPDEILIWLPQWRVLHGAEVIQGEAFPNLYSIRGTHHRCPVLWYSSIDALRSYNAEKLMLCHGRPVVGREAVADVLTSYRDAIQYVHDQSVRLINKGMRPDELAEHVKLPPHLASHPWLGEFYGTVRHAVRQIYNGYLGWFEGDPWTLDPLPPIERARRMVQLIGRDRILSEAREAIEQRREYTWAAEILTHVIRSDPNDTEARALKATALRRWAYLQMNINWRGWALSAAMELESRMQRSVLITFDSPDIVKSLPITNVLSGLTVRLAAERALDTHMSVGFRFSDINEQHSLEIRRGICQLHTNRIPSDVVGIVVTTKTVIERVLLHELSLREAIDSGLILIEGSREDVSTFFSYFEPKPNGLIPLVVR